jgi:hypothetical protein
MEAFDFTDGLFAALDGVVGFAVRFGWPATVPIPDPPDHLSVHSDLVLVLSGFP